MATNIYRHPRISQACRQYYATLEEPYMHMIRGRPKRRPNALIIDHDAIATRAQRCWKAYRRTQYKGSSAPAEWF